ncbi:SH3 domain-containing protein [Streptomyces sp. NPDC050636]|uniref:SH3 domain-containing protein n=1 Tax=Streptomyces sp. NPDC050636 TaxID=3154510 RepID=UPI00341B523E
MRLKFLAPAIASAALIGTAMTGGIATAATPGTTHTAAATKAAAADCVNAEAQESVKIRKERKLNSTAVGLFTKGATTCIRGRGTGQSYNLCNRTGNDWYKITYRGNTGWIPAACGSREL